jgi:hypothetical protein
MNLFPLFVCCACGELTFDCVDTACVNGSLCCHHTYAFSTEKKISPTHLVHACRWAAHFRRLHEQRRIELLKV